MNKLKKENYRSLLEDVDYLKKEVSIHNELADLFEQTRSTINADHKSSIYEHEVPKEEKNILAGTSL